LDNLKEVAEEDILEEGDIWKREQTLNIEDIYMREEEGTLSVVRMEEEAEDK
jgi:hypothetical protein